MDTNIPSELTRETPGSRVAAFLRKAGKESVYLSVMTIGEIRKGIGMLPAGQKRNTLQDWLDIRCAFLVRGAGSRGRLWTASSLPQPWNTALRS